MSRLRWSGSASPSMGWRRLSTSTPVWICSTRGAPLGADSSRRSEPAWEIAVAIRTEADVVNARQTGRELAAAIGFNRTDQALIATAISELARNILNYA